MIKRSKRERKRRRSRIVTPVGAEVEGRNRKAKGREASRAVVVVEVGERTHATRDQSHGSVGQKKSNLFLHLPVDPKSG